MRVFLDTNILIDLIAGEAAYAEPASNIVKFLLRNKHSIFISTLSIPNTEYVTRKIVGKLHAQNALQRIGEFSTLVNSTGDVISRAILNPDFPDFEDGIQFYSAIDATVSLIVSRNVNDFKNSSIPVYAPDEFLTKFSQ